MLYNSSHYFCCLLFYPANIYKVDTAEVFVVIVNNAVHQHKKYWRGDKEIKQA